MFSNLLNSKKKKNSQFDLDKHSIGDAELDFWRIVEASNEDKRLIIRLRIEKPNLPDIDNYIKSVSIVWKYESTENGLPSNESKVRQDEFEDSLEILTMYNNLSFLMGVSTGLGEKEWIFYVKDTEEFMAIFNDLLKNSPEYPITVNFYDDKEWTVWKEELDFFQKSGQGS